MSDELSFIASLAQRFGPPPTGEVWAGDDAAVVRPPARNLLLAVDPMVQGVHFLDVSADVGWTAMARNVSDIAAMGGVPLHAMVSLVIPPACDIEPVVDGLDEARIAMCPIVGGDTSSGATLVITVAVTGAVDGDPVLRSGARPGDHVFVTGELGVERPRPEPRVAEGTAARLAGATSMIDVSDGLALDLRRVAAASGVGIRVDTMPGDITRGEDYELAFTAPDRQRVLDAFAGVRPPIEIGVCTADPNDTNLPEGGWRHTW